MSEPTLRSNYKHCTLFCRATHKTILYVEWWITNWNLLRVRSKYQHVVVVKNYIYLFIFKLLVHMLVIALVGLFGLIFTLLIFSYILQIYISFDHDDGHMVGRICRSYVLMYVPCIVYNLLFRPTNAQCLFHKALFCVSMYLHHLQGVFSCVY
jgi:hypothetical protein